MNPRRSRLFVDALVVTVLVVAVSLLAVLPFNPSALNPFARAWENFDLTDFYYVQESRQHVRQGSADIVLVNIGRTDTPRLEIARTLEVLRRHDPKVIGLDIVFEERSDDSLVDQFLRDQIRLLGGRIVGAARFDRTGGLTTSDPYFELPYGYVNVAGERHDRSKIRYFEPARPGVSGVESFASAIARQADSGCYARLGNRRPVREVIRYLGNREAFLCIDHNDVDERAAVCEGRVVLVGWMGQFIGDSTTVEDKYYTPVDSRLFGLRHPDMFGVVIHANILHMILSGSYVSQLPAWLETGCGLLLVFGVVALFLVLRGRYLSSYNLFSRVVQMLAIIAMVFVGVVALRYFDVRVNMAFGAICVAVSAEVLQFYEYCCRSLYGRTHLSLFRMYGIERS